MITESTDPPVRPCSVDGCSRRHKAHGYCSLHYRRWLRHGDAEALRYTGGGRKTAAFRHFTSDLDAVVAAYEGGAFVASLAERYGVSTGTVRKYLRERGVTIRKRGHGLDGPTRLKLQGERLASAVRDYEAEMSLVDVARKYGVTRHTMRRALERAGTDRRSYRQLRVRRPDGYVLIWVAPDDPMRVMGQSRRGRVFEHRLVMARHIGRPLLPTETVHHRNGVRDDNRLENLELRQGKHGYGQAWRCCDCGSLNVEAI